MGREATTFKPKNPDGAIGQASCALRRWFSWPLGVSGTLDRINNYS